MEFFLIFFLFPLFPCIEAGSEMLIYGHLMTYRPEFEELIGSRTQIIQELFQMWYEVSEIWKV